MKLLVDAKVRPFAVSPVVLSSPAITEFAKTLIIILVHKLVGVGRKVVVSAFGLGIGYPVLGGLGQLIFSLAILAHNTNSRFKSFAFRFSIRFTFRLLSLSAILAAFSIVRMWSNSLVSAISDKLKSSPDTKNSNTCHRPIVF